MVRYISVILFIGLVWSMPRLKVVRYYDGNVYTEGGGVYKIKEPPSQQSTFFDNLEYVRINSDGTIVNLNNYITLHIDTGYDYQKLDQELARITAETQKEIDDATPDDFWTAADKSFEEELDWIERQERLKMQSKKTTKYGTTSPEEAACLGVCSVISLMILLFADI